VLRLEKVLFLSCVRAVQDVYPNASDWQEFLESEMTFNVEQELRSSILKLNSAGLPDLLGVNKRFEAFIGRFLHEDFAGELYNQPYLKFGMLREAFQTMAKDYFGDDYDTYYSRGGMNGFKDLISRVAQARPETHYFMPKSDYIPIYFKLPRNQRHLVQEKPDSTLNSIDFILDQVREILNNSPQEVPPIVIIVSSVPRSGEKKTDVNLLYDQLNTEFPDANIALWVDASQDPNRDLKGDVVVRSKLVAGTGGGTVQVSKKYQEEDTELKITEAVMDRSGFPTDIMAKTIASMFCSLHKWGHQVSDLLVRPRMWEFKGKGGYLSEELIKAKQYYLASEVLTKNIELSKVLI
jgi:hypothetical protein